MNPYSSSPEWRGRLVWLVILGYVSLTTFASMRVPIFEAPDESSHYLYIRHLVNQRAFPVMALDGPRFSEFHQPPLYYLLAAGLSSGTRDDGLAEFLSAGNPFVGFRAGEIGNDNKNAYLHTRAESFPFRGFALGVHLVRLLSTAMGLGTVLASYSIARQIFGPDRWLALGAVSLVAFNPAIIALSGTANNDNLIALAGNLIILNCLRLVRESEDYWRWLCAGLLWGIAILTKMSGLVLGIPIVAVALLSLRTTPWIKVTQRTAITGLSALAVAGAWMLRNVWLYGEPTALSRNTQVVGDTGPANLLQAFSLLPWTFTTYWARFGQGFVPGPVWVYWIFAVLLLAALIGWLRIGLQGKIRPSWFRNNHGEWVILWLGVAGFEASVFANSSVSPSGAPGRYLFPVAGAIAVSLFAGIVVLSPKKWQESVARVLTIGMASLAAWLILFLLPASYVHPPFYDVSQFDERSVRFPLDLQYGGLFRLRGYDLGEQEVHPGEDLMLTLYWEVLAPTATNYVEFAQIAAPGDRVLGARDTHPGLGNFPTSDWMPGNIVVDTIPIPINPDSPAPGYFSIDVGFYEFESGLRLPVSDWEGRPVPSFSIGWARVVPNEPRDLRKPVPLGVQFGTSIELEACEYETSLLGLKWRALDWPGADYTVFVHVLDGESQIIGQADHVPNGGLFPTRAWQAGDTVVDSFSMPTGTWDSASRVLVGLYSPLTGQRIPAYGSSGELLPDSAVELPAECISG